MDLRYYQRDAIDATYRYLEAQTGNPCIVIPTGGGKTPVMATIARDVTKWNGRVAIVAHRKELLEQTHDKLVRVDADMDVGIYSASLNSRQKDNSVICTQIQSVHKRAFEFGSFNLIMVDEAHLIPPSGEGMYRQFLEDCRLANPKVRIVGLTATPYRMTSGWLCGSDEILNDISYEVGIKELIAQGYLCPLVSRLGMQADTSKLHIRGGEFIAAEANDLMMSLVNSSVRDVIARTKDRHSVIVFCQSVEHAQLVTEMLLESGESAAMISGETISTLRKLEQNRFKQGLTKYLVNIDVLTTGFDAPNVDCVVLLRPTMSPGLYYQMVGRGLRIDESKRDCLVLDYGNNIEQHGPIDAIEVRARRGGRGKEKPEVIGDDSLARCKTCNTYIDVSFESCPECGAEMPKAKREINHQTTSSEAEILSDGEPEVIRYVVTDVAYSVHEKKGAPPDHPKTLRVTYTIAECFEDGSHGNLTTTISEWICVEHTGFAQAKAVAWWCRRSQDPMPRTAQHAVDIAEGGGLAIPLFLTTTKKPGQKYAEITEVIVGEIPEPPEIIEDDGDDPFEWGGSLVEKWSKIDEEEVPW